ncbi:MAG: LytTR family DNA-binding domain-containing protein [Bacteroidota bacterium]
MYKCLIVDDEELARNLIRNHLSQLDDFEIVAMCESAIDAGKVLQQQPVDLLFLDIEMPVLQGTEFFKNLIHKPKVIFTTAFRDYALDGFELNAVDYLLKPITFGRFYKAIEKFKESCGTTTPPPPTAEVKKEDSLFIRKDRKQVKLMLDDIRYIESVKDYIKIVTANDQHLIKHSITAFGEQLDGRFMRIHRSFIINIEKVTAYTKHDIEIGEIEIPIGENYKSDLIKKLG